MWVFGIKRSMVAPKIDPPEDPFLGFRLVRQTGFGQNSTARTMSLISTTQYVAAMKRQRSLTDPQWLQRCDELAQQQPTMFFELLTFPSDGVPADAARKLIDCLSALQFASREVSESVSAPVQMPEFRAAVLKSMQFFHAISTDDRPHFDRMMKAWYEGMVEGGEPVVWAGVLRFFANLRSWLTSCSSRWRSRSVLLRRCMLGGSGRMAADSRGFKAGRPQLGS